MKRFCNIVCAGYALLLMSGVSFGEKAKIVFFNVDAIDSAWSLFQKKDIPYPYFYDRSSIIADAVGDIAPDVLAFSEAAFEKARFESLSERLNNLGYVESSGTPGQNGLVSQSLADVFGYILPRKAVWRNSGLIIFTAAKHRLEFCEEHVFKNRAGRDLIVKKGALLCKVLLNKNESQPLYVSTAHLQAGSYSGYFGDEKRARTLQIEELMAFLKKHVPAEERSRLILGGDFNFDIQSELSVLFSSEANNHLGLVNLHQLNLPYPGAKRPDYSTYHGANCIIDHVFAPASGLNKFRLSIDPVQDKFGQPGSDHKLLLVEGHF